MRREYGSYHKSVLLKESLDFLIHDENGLYVDCTAGEGGHTKKILENYPNINIVSIDRDNEVLDIAKKKCLDYEDRVTFYYSSYFDFDEVLRKEGLKKVNGFLLDAGISNYQLKAEGRGFSYDRNEDLDMRMDLNSNVSAKDIVNGYSLKDLSRIIVEYGDERRFGRKIAYSILRRRPINTTEQLVNAVKAAIPPSIRYGSKRHFASRTFQAIRIEVNKELHILEETLKKMPKYLVENGRIVIISFHSLEDRIVKNFFKGEKDLEIITKKPFLPSEEELRANPQARSAKLRAAKRV